MRGIAGTVSSVLPVCGVEEDREAAQTAADSWENDTEYLRGIKEGYVAQEKGKVHQVIMDNHLHNAENQYEIAISGSSISSAEKQAASAEWATAQGVYLGRQWFEHHTSQAFPETASIVSNPPALLPLQAGVALVGKET